VTAPWHACASDELGNYTERSAPFSSQQLRKSRGIRPTSGASTSPDVCDPYTRTTPESTGPVATPQDDLGKRSGALRGGGVAVVQVVSMKAGPLSRPPVRPLTTIPAKLPGERCRVKRSEQGHCEVNTRAHGAG
jgi:hypothetical protein